MSTTEADLIVSNLTRSATYIHHSAVFIPRHQQVSDLIFWSILNGNAFDQDFYRVHTLPVPFSSELLQVFLVCLFCLLFRKVSAKRFFLSTEDDLPESTIADIDQTNEGQQETVEPIGPEKEVRPPSQISNLSCSSDESVTWNNERTITNLPSPQIGGGCRSCKTSP